MRFKRFNNQAIPLDFPFYYFPIIGITLIGLADSIYLSVSHYRNYIDIGYQSFCAVSKAINCDTVSQSPYSIFLGAPVPIWGVMGYGFFLFLLGYAWPLKGGRKRVFTLLMAIATLFCIYSIILAVISSYLIRSYCIMCILSYSVNLALLFYVWIIRKRFQCESFFHAIKLDILYLLGFRKSIIPVFSIFTVSAIIIALFFPPYWKMIPPALSKNMSTGITEDGHPWIGAEEPELEIVEFTDYRCFQCKKMHFYLRRIVENHPEKIRLVHRNFPMDHTINPLVKEPFHTGAAKLAMLAVYASEKGKFWEMNDYLFDISKDIEALNIRNIAEDVGLDFTDMRYIFRDKRLRNILWIDILEGIKDYHLTGTPGFIIKEKVYLGQLPPDLLRSYIE
jgi:uncharacterized membrane protein/protein-disulfide isomerase